MSALQPTPNSGDRSPRIRIHLPGKPSGPSATELFELRAAVEASQKRLAADRKVRKPFTNVKVGSVEIPIYKDKDRRWTIAWYEGTKRKRTRRADLQDAKDLAERKAKDMSLGLAFTRNLTDAHYAMILRVIEILAPTRKAPELAVAEYAEAILELPEGTTLKEAVKYFRQHRPRGISILKIPALIEEMLESKRKDGIGKRWADSLKSQLKHFSAKFDCPLNMLASSDLDTWLRSLAGGLRNRANHRSAVLQLVNYAKTRNYLPKIWSELDEIPTPKLKDSEIKILTPEQMVQLLAVAPPDLVPFIVLTGFAGIRHQEMCAEKSLLDWRNIDLEKLSIYVPRSVGKTGDDRIVPIQPNLAEWLKPYVRRNGPVCKLGNASNSLCRAKRAAGIPAGKNETRNTLRKSFISYRLAIVKDAARVAEEAGNSIAKIKSNYKRTVPESEAHRWFDISPTEAGILQLQFHLAR